ncbi:hypothetical protein [Acinetobacter proteolyticus]|uniref:Uncharacterized protein n=1 Tax=Acinetobacter proteolyticus TaxID=1776741 RepID=A0A2N0WIF4_9GAMM|nr:hypothetical protein [Acinetobacter proteolyticus]MBK5645725.1 hypothetical protein [Acinetobacter sp.]PKF35546.1 hypothetical protein CW311_04450 [Acinetobacter proteolyticus]
MSLYNNFEIQIKRSDISSFLKKGSKSLIGSAINKSLNSALGQQFATKVAPYGINTNMISTIANDYAGNYIDKQVNKADEFLSKQVRTWLSRSGYSYEGIPEKSQYREFIALSRARKNHFIIEIESNLTGSFSKKINLFVTDIDLNPMNISGEKRRVGGAFVDTPTGAEATEIRVTTMDDHLGTIKKWYEQHGAAVVASDGTFGVPASYALKITVLHAVVDDEAKANAFKNSGLFRVANYELQLSRREQAMQEITLTFTQIDSFMR